MDYLPKIDEILALLKAEGYEEIHENLNNTKLASFTSTELLMSFTYKLKEALKNNLKLENKFSYQLSELIKFCSNNGMVIK